MSRILSIGTAVPPYRHKQQEILQFMLNAYQPEAGDRRKIALLYERSGIDCRYSVIPDYSSPVTERLFYSQRPDLEPFPDLEKRLQLYHQWATRLSVDAIRDCLPPGIGTKEITTLITVSCTGMSAPGLDISVMQELELSPNIHRSSVNFMGCYAAIHALRMADHICKADPREKVLIVCTELCTIHFQKDCAMDSIASGLLFGDGAAAVLVVGSDYSHEGYVMRNFFSEVALHGRGDMAWHLSSKGFLMHLSAYIPQLLQSGINNLLNNAMKTGGHKREEITAWAIHPGGKKILDSIRTELGLGNEELSASYNVLKNFGNMSSPTILFVLKDLLSGITPGNNKIFTAAFGPGLTMETLILEA